MRKIMWGPDSGMMPTNAAKTTSVNTGRPEMTEAKSKFCISYFYLFFIGFTLDLFMLRGYRVFLCDGVEPHLFVYVCSGFLAFQYA